MEEVFTAGLLHDMGKVILGTFVEVDDEPIKEIVEKDKLAFNEEEMMVLGIDHAEVAGELLRAWNLPEEVVEAARWHHQPSQCNPENQVLVDLVHSADVMCLNVGWGLGADGMQYRVDEEAGRRLGIRPSITEAVIAETMIGVEDLITLFQPKREGVPNGVQHSHR